MALLERRSRDVLGVGALGQATYAPPSPAPIPRSAAGRSDADDCAAPTMCNHRSGARTSRSSSSVGAHDGFAKAVCRPPKRHVCGCSNRFRRPQNLKKSIQNQSLTAFTLPYTTPIFRVTPTAQFSRFSQHSIRRSSHGRSGPPTAPDDPRPTTTRNRSRSSRASMPCASGRACISATPTTARACITWSTRSSTTRSTRRSPAMRRR